nr:RNA-dependent RNA polymerase [Heterobasidion ourmia-like virus 1]
MIIPSPVSQVRSTAGPSDSAIALSEHTTRSCREFQNLLKAVFPAQHESSLPPKEDLKGLKEWCTAPIESMSFQTRNDFSYAASRFLFRKVLPSAPGNPVPEFLTKLATQKPSDPFFLSFCRVKIQQQFPIGWDKEYSDIARRCTVSIRACLERSRSGGGARGELLGTLTHEEFLRAVLDGDIKKLPLERKVMVVDDSGKKRIVTVGSCFQQQLLPLHVTMYSFLSKKKWLLRGEAKPNSFKEFTVSSGEVFVSGDYEAATDNVVKKNSSTIMGLVLAQARHIPAAIIQMAIGSLSSILVYGEQTVIQQSGQLMGNLLSFPLLCLLNFLAFKFVVRRNVPLRINGDDIAFRATPAEFDAWSQSVGASGLTLSKGKTLIHRVFFSLNSTFFQARVGSKPSLVPVIRSKSIFELVGEDDILTVTDRVHSANKGFWPQARQQIKKCFLRFQRKGIKGVGGSLNRGHGLRISTTELKQVGLYDRELYYFSYPTQKDIAERRLGQRIPGYKKVKGKSTVEEEEKWRQAVIQHAWTLESVEKNDSIMVGVGYRDEWIRERDAKRGKISLRGLQRLRKKHWETIVKKIEAFYASRKRKGRVKKNYEEKWVEECAWERSVAELRTVAVGFEPGREQLRPVETFDEGSTQS